MIWAAETCPDEDYQQLLDILEKDMIKSPPFSRRGKRAHKDAPMLKLLSQHDRGSNFPENPPCVAPEYPQQWSTYIKAEDAGWASGQ